MIIFMLVTIKYFYIFHLARDISWFTSRSDYTMAKHMVGLLRLSSDYTVCKNILCELVYIRPDSKGLASDYTMGKHTINNIT